MRIECLHHATPHGARLAYLLLPEMTLYTWSTHVSLDHAPEVTIVAF